MTVAPTSTPTAEPAIRALVERWGGRLEVDSAPGQGTRVRVLLPALPTLEPA